MADNFDWCSFFALFWNDKGIKCKINIPDTVVFRYSTVSAWYFTNREGYIQRHSSQNTTLEAIRKRFLTIANEDDANYSKFVALVRASDGRPQLLRSQAFQQLVELLSDRIEAGHTDASPEVETPSVMQSFTQPFADTRFITTYVNSGSTITCHTFQRKYSRRYTAVTPAAQMQDAAATNSMIALSAAQDGGSGDDSSLPVDPVLKMQFRKLAVHLVQYIEKAHGLTLAGIVCEWIRDATGKVYLLAVLRTEWASNAAGHGAGSLSSSLLLAETQEEPESHACDDPRVSEPGHSAASHGPPEGFPPLPPLPEDAFSSPRDLATSNYDTLHERPMSGFRSAGVSSPSPLGRSVTSATYGKMVFSPPVSPTHVPHAQSPHSDGLPSNSRPSLVVSPPLTSNGVTDLERSVTGQIRPPGVPGVGAGTTKSALAHYPGGNRAGGLGISVSNTWPSVQHDAQLSPSAVSGSFHQGMAYVQPGTSPMQPTVSYSGYVGQGGEGRGNNRAMSAHLGTSNPSLMADRQQQRPPRPGTAPVAFGRAVQAPNRGGSAAGTYPGINQPVGGGVGGASPNGAQNASDQAYRSPSPVRQNSARPGTSSSTGHVNAGVRGAPLMMQHVTKELESLRDQLLFQNQMAEANAAKVRQLEKEKELMLQAYERKVMELDAALRATRDSLSSTQAERTEAFARAQQSESRVDELELKVHQLQATIDSERSTVMSTLRECQARDAAVAQRGEQLEAEVLRLTERLKEETAAVNALKRQLLQYSDIAEKYKTVLREGEYEPGMQAVIDKVHNMFATQANPLGEQYAVQKTLSQYNPQLRAVFLYYSQLEEHFTQHWPPSMAFQQFMLFCKDTETSDPRATSRVNPDLLPLKMLHPRDCETVFRTYAELDMQATDSTGPVLSYEAFLAAIVDLSNRVRRDTPYLSEGIRQYFSYYMSKAQRVQTQGQMTKGKVRLAVEATVGGKEVLSGRDSPKGPPANQQAQQQQQQQQQQKKRGSARKGGNANGLSPQASRPDSVAGAVSLMSLSGRPYHPPPNLRIGQPDRSNNGFI